jgi:phospholipid/cholesterol/gamma-HCH transport system substrate-binding protein
MENKVGYVTVGFFIFSVLIAATVFTLWYSNYAEDKSYKHYRINTSESVSGLNEKASVKLMGVNVGEVERLFVNPNNSEEVSIIIKVDAKTPIKEDSYAIIKPQGITGLAYLEIEGSKHEAKALQTSEKLDNMGVIQTKPSLFSRVDTSFASIATKLETTLDAIANLSQNTDKILSDANAQNIQTLLQNSAEVSASLNKEMQSLSVTIQNISSASKQLHDLSQNEIKTMLQSVKDAANAVENLMAKFDKKADNGQYDFKVMLGSSLESFEQSMDRLDSLLQNLEDSPSDLLFKSTKQNLGPGE